MPTKDWYIVSVQGCHFRQLGHSFCTSRSWKDSDRKGRRRDSLGKGAMGRRQGDKEMRREARAGEGRGSKDGSVKKEPADRKGTADLRTGPESRGNLGKIP